MNGTLADRIAGYSRVHLDSMAVIYFLQDDTRFAPLLAPVFERLRSGSLEGVSSYVTLLEVLVKPLRDGRHEVAREYSSRLTTTRGLQLLPLTRAIAERGAAIRASHNFKTPDAIQLATAAVGGAQAVITNDLAFKRFEGLPVVVLDDCLN